MNWKDRFTKLASIIENIDAKEGRPITREYINDMSNNRPEEYNQLMQYIRSVVVKKLKQRGEKTIDSNILARMENEVLSKFLERTDADVKAQMAETERKRMEAEQKARTQPPENPTAHVDDHHDYIEFDEGYYNSLREKHNLPADVPIARPLVKKPLVPKPSPVTQSPKSVSDISTRSPTVKMQPYVGPDGKKRFRMAGVDAEHPANGQLCMCSGRIARVCSCMRDGNGEECAVVRYDDGEFDVALLDWREDV
jgi:regulator of replication initiation timing